MLMLSYQIQIDVASATTWSTNNATIAQPNPSPTQIQMQINAAFLARQLKHKASNHEAEMIGYDNYP